ncbi:MAG: endo alpha-1,4 polygalactosaminidase [Solirubrobacterales bacterium]|nr:endo alpha-1,4 polygalactosaminidase [Solirubrobacterales bacterium]
MSLPRSALPVCLLAVAAVATGTVAPQLVARPVAPPREPVEGPWQLQVQGKVDVCFLLILVDLDGDATSAATVRALHDASRYVICYIDAGSYENFRVDHARFPRSVKGRPNGWPGERWLDIRRLDILAPILKARMRTCARKGFDAVDPDNVDGYANKTGFGLSRADSLRFTRWLARTAHGLGLSVGLKNALELVPSLAPRFDFAVVEQCFQYDECERLAPFLQRSKPVYVVEYEGSYATLCAKAAALGVHLTLAQLALDDSGEPCPARPPTVSSQAP